MPISPKSIVQALDIGSQVVAAGYCAQFLQRPMQFQMSFDYGSDISWNGANYGEFRRLNQALQNT